MNKQICSECKKEISLEISFNKTGHYVCYNSKCGLFRKTQLREDKIKGAKRMKNKKKTDAGKSANKSLDISISISINNDKYLTIGYDGKYIQLNKAEVVVLRDYIKEWLGLSDIMDCIK